jgi:hypothetical protein
MNLLRSNTHGVARTLPTTGRTILAGGIGARAAGGDSAGAGLSFEGVVFRVLAKRHSREFKARRRRGQLSPSPELSPGGSGRS